MTYASARAFFLQKTLKTLIFVKNTNKKYIYTLYIYSKRGVCDDFGDSSLGDPWVMFG